MKSLQQDRPGRAARLWKTVFLMVSLAGIALSGYLLYVHRVPAEQSSMLFRICSAGAFDCGRVNGSEYAAFLGMPVAAWGIALYLCAGLLMLLRVFSRDGSRRAVDAALLLVTGAGALGTIPLLFISLSVIRAFCLYCVIAWACNIALFAIMLVIIARDEDGTRRPFALSLKELFGGLADFRALGLPVIRIIAIGFASVGIAAVLSLIPGSQAEPIARHDAIDEEAQVLDSFRRQSPVEIALSGAPVYYGNPRAKVTIVEFFNFDCDVCRDASGVIKTVMEKFPGKVKLHLLHFPIDGTCNRSIMRRGNGLSCKASIIALGLQKTDRYVPFVKYIMQRRDHLSRELVLGALASIDMDLNRLKTITDERTAEKLLVLQMMQGAALGLKGTPAFVINGRALPQGLPPAGLLEKAVGLEVERVYGEK